MKRKGKGQYVVARGACPMCGGDVCTSYKANRPNGPYPKCLRCHRIYGSVSAMELVRITGRTEL